MDAFEALRDHYLAGIDCNEENHTDTAACSCALMMASPQPSIGQAVQQWIDHVRDVVEGRWTQEGALKAIRAARVECPDCRLESNIDHSCSQSIARAHAREQKPTHTACMDAGCLDCGAVGDE